MMPKSGVGERFTEFMEGWAHELEVYLEQLLRAVSINDHHDVEAEAALVSKLTQHHKGYYTVKWALAHEDVLPFFSQAWATPLEKAYSWLTGWKPSTMFKLLLSTTATSSGAVLIHLTQQQLETMEDLRQKVRLEEDKVERDMERQHVALADRRMVELARLASRGTVSPARINGLVEVALKGVADGLEKVVRAADCVRLRTLKGILEILTPPQCLAFFAASSTLLIRLRQLGGMRERASAAAAAVI
ncbi:unnamed protein product [Linum trigynum]|uniref:DOG1 domain-containing protein n=2 Tax=Linum trigynum TaxID=586398 RepID=A0AAV2FSC8_9ROSI